MTTRLRGLTRVTLDETPIVCHSCVWWQSRTGRRADKDRWIERIEEDFGPWGCLYYDDDGRVLGSMQYGPARLFPRAAELPGTGEDSFGVAAAVSDQELSSKRAMGDDGATISCLQCTADGTSNIAGHAFQNAVVGEAVFELLEREPHMGRRKRLAELAA